RSDRARSAAGALHRQPGRGVAPARGGAFVAARRAGDAGEPEGTLVSFRRRQRSPAPGLLRRRGAAAAAGALVPGLPAAARVLRLSVALPLRRDRRAAQGP